MLRDIRVNYNQHELREEDVNVDPVVQFRGWMEDAIAAGVAEPTAMVLSTVDANGFPESRVVLLKEIITTGFVFFTNYNSRKGQELAKNKHVSLNFFWPGLERQVRIKGEASKVSRDISVDYFNSRPGDSRLGAWASPQSQVIGSKAELDDRFVRYKNRFGNNIPCPEHWGGYWVSPVQIEFWQGRPNRMHDRLCYELQNGNWVLYRLAP